MMKTYVAFLRAINVGGTGKLAMADLKKICEKLGFENVATYIQSGNVVFDSDETEAKVVTLLEGALEKKLKKQVGVAVRSAAQLKAALAKNPFPKGATNRVMIFFANRKIAPAELKAATGMNGEELAMGGSEVFVHYGDGMGTSKLKLPFAKEATARNLNTVAKMLELAQRD